MKALQVIPVILILMVAFQSCKKDKETEFNMLKITEGEFDGYSHEYSPNLGFWAEVDATTRYVHLVLGDDDNMATGGEDVMSIVFYYTGVPTVLFPSPQGQWVRFGINFEGTVYNFRDDAVTLTITQIDDLHFEGNISGVFMDVFDMNRKISINMNLMLTLQQI